MRITKKVPIKKGGKAGKKNHSARDAIRDAYTQSQRDVKIIPAKRDTEAEDEKKRLRVCAYCRVSTDEESQEGSYELQVQHFTQKINENPDWDLVDIYADKGISGTSVVHREDFLRMIEDCKAGKIDLIITKQVSRFARNVLDSLHYIRVLRSLDPPVGILFETENLNTLDKSSEMIITVLSLVAQSESEQKSNSLKWSYKKRFSKGVRIHPNWALYGYESGEDGEWVIVEDEAEIVRTIYDLYIGEYSSSAIAGILTKSGIPTVKGKSEWSAGSVISILRNEKYCGDALCQKTVTVDLFPHKVVKNVGIEPQYFIEGHHRAIVEKDVWLRAQQIRKEGLHKRHSRIRKPKVVVKGPLAGFILIDPEWNAEYIDSMTGLFYDESPTYSLISEDEHFTIERK